MGGEGQTGAATGATPDGGATPPAATGNGTATGAMPAAAAGGSPASSGSTAATAGDDDLGETGKRLLKEARDAAKAAENRAKAAEARVSELETGQQTDSERAVAQARREAAAEERATWAERARKAEVKGALRGAGIVDDAALELALGSPTFRDLKVDNSTGDVEGVTEAVEAFKSKHAYLFAKASAPTPPPPGGSWSGSEGGAKDTPVQPGLDRIRRAYETPTS